MKAEHYDREVEAILRQEAGANQRCCQRRCSDDDPRLCPIGVLFEAVAEVAAQQCRDVGNEDVYYRVVFAELVNIVGIGLREENRNVEQQAKVAGQPEEDGW